MTQTNSTPSRDALIDDFLASAGWGSAKRRKLAGDASFRRYERIYESEKRAVLMDAPPDKENIAPFIHVAEYMVQAGYSAPRILAQDKAHGFLLLEDLGDDSFTRVLKDNPQEEMQLYGRAVELLIDIHTNNYPPPDIPPYDEALLLKEVSLFCDWFMPAVMGKEKAGALKGEYLALWSGIIPATQWHAPVFVHRDYHADNLMWLPARDGIKKVGVLDFQDAVLGSPAYDMVSFLEDARRDVAPDTVQNVIEHYTKETKADRAQFFTWYDVLGAQRNSKIVGVFTRLAVRDGKQHYLHYLPRVWKHLERDLTHPALAPLRQWMDKHISKEWRGEITL